jgi:hypothetical protein
MKSFMITKRGKSTDVERLQFSNVLSTKENSAEPAALLQKEKQEGCYTQTTLMRNQEAPSPKS